MLRLIGLLAVLVLVLACAPAGAEQWAPDGATVVRPFTALDTFAFTGDLDNSTDVSLVGARAGRRHCVTGVSVSTLATLGSDQRVRLLSNDTVIWQCALDAAATSGCAQDLLVPVCTAVGEALEIDASADPTDDLIYYNVQGYTTQ